jgi:hypothetical protein
MQHAVACLLSTDLIWNCIYSRPCTHEHGAAEYEVQCIAATCGSTDTVHQAAHVLLDAHINRSAPACSCIACLHGDSKSQENLNAF